MPPCRLCNSPLEKGITLNHIPRQAQYLPDQAGLDLDQGIDLTLFFCPSCGIIQHTLPVVSYYKDVIRATAYSAEMKQFRIRQLAELSARYNLRGKHILEVGAGCGEYLALLRGAGMNAQGIEHGAAQLAACAEQGLPVIEGFLGSMDSPLPGAPFDAFFSFNYFEHIPELPALLRGIRANLAPGALGFVEVPNFDQSIRESVVTDIVLDHVYYFTSESLAAFMRTHGFDVLGLTTIWHDNIIACAVKKREAPDLRSFIDRKDMIRQALHEFTARHAGKKIAVWGAGHQSLTALALCDACDSACISMVIDSAPFKQHKYTPVTHIPVLPPAALDENNVEAVLVIAGAYTGEIIRSLKARHNSLFCAALTNYGIEDAPCAGS